MLKIMDVIMRIFEAVIIVWGIYLAVTSKEFHQTLKYLITGRGIDE